MTGSAAYAPPPTSPWESSSPRSAFRLPSIRPSYLCHHDRRDDPPRRRHLARAAIRRTAPCRTPRRAPQRPDAVWPDDRRCAEQMSPQMRAMADAHLRRDVDARAALRRACEAVESAASAGDSATGAERATPTARICDASTCPMTMVKRGLMGAHVVATPSPPTRSSRPHPDPHFSRSHPDP